MAVGWGSASRRSGRSRPAGHLYGPGFYDLIRAGTRASASAVVPVVLAALDVRPGTVIDVGCGEGWWAAEFANHGCEVIGLDGAYVDGSPLGDRFIPHDLTEPLPAHLGARFDLAVSLEVIEHLPGGRAGSFVADLCALAPLTLFSGAIPGQGGVGHVNEQPTEVWAALFHDQGRAVSGALRWLIWGLPGVEPWYQQNLLLAAVPEVADRLPNLFRGPAAVPRTVVHPVTFDARRQR